jgi:hypothetical protein
VGERTAAAEGLTFLKHAPEAFRGRVVPLRDAPGYVGVRDGTHLVVLPATNDLRAHAGRTVRLSLGPRGTLQVEPTGLDRGR